MKTFVLTGLMAGFFVPSLAQLPAVRSASSNIPAQAVLQDASAESVGMSTTDYSAWMS